MHGISEKGRGVAAPRLALAASGNSKQLTPQYRLGSSLMFLPRGEEMREPGIICILTASLLICGCSHTKATFEDANDLFSRGSYTASLINTSRFFKNIPRRGIGPCSRWALFMRTRRTSRKTTGNPSSVSRNW